MLTFQLSVNLNGLEWVNLIQMTIKSTTVGKNPLEEMEPKHKQRPFVDVTGDGSKVRYCKEQYCLGTQNVRSMNQGKLEVVKQEMARVNINILGICEVKWTGMDEFNSNDQYIYNCGQESLRRSEVAIIVNKSLKCNTWMQSQK